MSYKKLYEARLQIKNFKGESFPEAVVTAKSIRKLYIRIQETYWVILGEHGGVVNSSITRIR